MPEMSIHTVMVCFVDLPHILQIMFIRAEKTYTIHLCTSYKSNQYTEMVLLDDMNVHYTDIFDK